MNKKSLSVRLQRRVKNAGLTISVEVCEKLSIYFDLLSRWNAKMNLTALDQRDSGLDRLLIEPLIAAKQLSRQRMFVMDIGSGNGSPAVPMKIAVPGISLCMVESKTRKAAFLREVVRQLDLHDTRVEKSRYEELLIRPALHETQDVLTVRAVRLEAKMLNRLQKFLILGGKIFLFNRSGNVNIPTILAPHFRWHATKSLIGSLESSLIILRKIDLRAHENEEKLRKE